MLEAYAAGVNAWIAARGRFAAPEFLALGAPEPWRPEHSLLWAKVMGLWLSGNWRGELDRARLAALLPPERLADLWPEDAQPRPAGRAAPALARPASGRIGASGEASPPRGHARSGTSRLLAAAALPGARDPAGLRQQRLDGRRAPARPPARRCSPPTRISASRRRSSGTSRASTFADGRMLAGATSPGVPGVVIGRNPRPRLGLHHHAFRHPGRLRRTAGRPGRLRDAGRPAPLHRPRGGRSACAAGRAGARFGCGRRGTAR